MLEVNPSLNNKRQAQRRSGDLSTVPNIHLPRRQKEKPAMAHLPRTVEGIEHKPTFACQGGQFLSRLELLPVL